MKKKNPIKFDNKPTTELKQPLTLDLEGGRNPLTTPLAFAAASSSSLTVSFGA